MHIVKNIAQWQDSHFLTVNLIALKVTYTLFLRPFRPEFLDQSELEKKKKKKKTEKLTGVEVLYTAVLLI